MALFDHSERLREKRVRGDSGRVVHVNDGVPEAVYIGRAAPRRRLPSSIWGNPFREAVHGRLLAVQLYRDYLRSSLEGKPLLAHLPDLRGKPLACWCRRDGEQKTAANACHGDVLIELLETYTDDELRAMASDEGMQP